MSEGRVRRNPRDRASMRRVPSAPAEVRPARVLPARTPLVAALLEADGGSLGGADAEALALAAAVAADAGHGLLAVCPGPELPAGLAEAGVDRVAAVPIADMARALAGGWSAARLSHAVAVGEAAADALRRLAAETGRPFRANVARVGADGIVCLEDGGRVERDRSPAPLLAGAPGRFRPPAVATPGEALPIALAVPPEAAGGLVDLGLERTDARSAPLAEADLVLAAGAGVEDWPLFHRLAEALGAGVGGSRVVCDAGHLPRDRQVGISGTPVAARCYIAIGVSGASQHLQGIEACRTVVAVNRDPHAPIHRRADLSVVADAAAFMAALLVRVERG